MCQNFVQFQNCVGRHFYCKKTLNSADSILLNKNNCNKPLFLYATTYAVMYLNLFGSLPEKSDGILMGLMIDIVNLELF